MEMNKTRAVIESLKKQQAAQIRRKKVRLSIAIRMISVKKLARKAIRVENDPKNLIILRRLTKAKTDHLQIRVLHIALSSKAKLRKWKSSENRIINPETGATVKTEQVPILPQMKKGQESW